MQIVDIDNRGRRNNIIFHNMPESAEGETADCSTFVSQFIYENLGIPQGEIGGAHRIPMGKPGNRGQGKKTRPIHVRFLRFQERETELRTTASSGKALKVIDKRVSLPMISTLQREKSKKSSQRRCLS